MSDRDKTNGANHNRPVETLRDGALKVAIFRNRGEKEDTYAMEPGRLYTDKVGQTREAKSLAGSEALRMAHLLTKGHDRVTEIREQDKREKSSSRTRDDGGRDR